MFIQLQSSWQLSYYFSHSPLETSFASFSFPDSPLGIFISILFFILFLLKVYSQSVSSTSMSAVAFYLPVIFKFKPIFPSQFFS